MMGWNSGEAVVAQTTHPDLWGKHWGGLDREDALVEPRTPLKIVTRRSSQEQPVYPSDNIRSRYVLGERIGKGHSGVVRTCKDMKTGELAACKSILKSKLKTNVKLAELAAEITSMKRLMGCPKIVQLKGLYEDAEAVHIVMDYCEQSDLFEFLSQRKRMSESGAARLLRQLAIALKHCAAKGVIHRDIKPENIFITSTPMGPDGTLNPQIKLGDFGLAVPLRPSCKTAQGMAGSCLYMAPELVQGLEYDEKIDVWGVGVTVYTALIGFLPFWGRNNNEIFAAILKGPPDYAQDPWPLVSPEAKHIIQWMLASDPNDRPTPEEILAHPWVKSVSSTVESPRVTRRGRLLCSGGSFDLSRVPLHPRPPKPSSSEMVNYHGLDASSGDEAKGSVDSYKECMLVEMGANTDVANREAEGAAATKFYFNSNLPPVQTRAPRSPPGTSGKPFRSWVAASPSPLSPRLSPQNSLASGATFVPRPPVSPRSPVASPSRPHKHLLTGIFKRPGGSSGNLQLGPRTLSEEDETGDAEMEIHMEEPQKEAGKERDASQHSSVDYSGFLCRPGSGCPSGSSSPASCGSTSPTAARNFFRTLDSPVTPLDGRLFGGYLWPSLPSKGKSALKPAEDG